MNQKEVSDELAVIFTKVTALSAKMNDTRNDNNSIPMSLMYVGTILNQLRIAHNGNMSIAQKEIEKILNQTIVELAEVIA